MSPTPLLSPLPEGADSTAEIRREVPLYWHPEMALHDLAAGHVAMDSYRLQTVASSLLCELWAQHVWPSPAPRSAFLHAHDEAFVAQLEASAALPTGGELAFDGETKANKHTWRTLQLSAGAWTQAVDSALNDKTPFAFCVGYAGHHARRNRAAGFCFTNQAAIAAHHALASGAPRVAVLDIDTHAGDGTVLSLLDTPNAFFGETYQPGFPGAFLKEPPPERMVRYKLDSASRFRDYWSRIFEAAAAFRPSLVLVSAGFDAHRDDPLTHIGIRDDDYRWLGSGIKALGVPVVAGLEGGYNLVSTVQAAKTFILAAA